MYRDGSGVTQNVAIAAKWFKSAANLGRAESQLDIGELYEAGRGIAQDYVQAHMWYNLAAAAGVPGAEARRNELATKMTPEQLSEAQKFASQWRPNNDIK
jgi:TPR repeat protein